MGIIIRKKATGEVFDVMPGFKLELRNTSPIFNELGSKTISTSLPKTPNNIKLLGFSNRLDLRTKPELKIPVIVSSGSYVRVGVLYESSAYNSDKTFGITIAFNEGIMYEAMSDILLTELSDLPVIESTPDHLYTMMNELATKENPEDRLSVFYVTFKKQTYKENEDDEQDSVWAEYVNWGETVSSGQGQLAKRKFTFVIEDNKIIEIGVPFGYGITPFVRVWYLLEKVFGHFGYKVGDNPFKEHFQLRRLCVLNNVADAIVNGTLDYKQLLPPVTINDFLNALYCRFGMKVSFDSNTNTVNLFLIRDTFRSQKTAAISLAEFPDIDYTSPKQLKLTVAKNLDNSESETDTYEEFLAKYNNTVGQVGVSASDLKVGGIYYDPKGGFFIQYSTINEEIKTLSSALFDWNKKDEGLAVEEISSVDEGLTMRHDDGENFSKLYYGLSHQLKNVILSINGTTQETDTENVLAFAYDMGMATLQLAPGNIFDYGYKYGSIFPYAYQSDHVLQKDPDGNEFRYSLLLTGEYGAFNQFFKEYDAFLRHSNHTVKLQSFNFVHNLSNIDFRQKRIVDNHPLLLDKFDHDLDGHWGQMCKIEARTLRLYEPYDLDKEQALPVPEDIRYKWQLFSDQEQVIVDKGKALVQEIVDRGSRYRNVKLIEWRITDDPDKPGDRTYWFLPPTEYQYQNHIQTGSRTHTCTVRYYLRYEENTGSLFNPDWEEREELKYPDVDYKSWFEPEDLE